MKLKVASLFSGIGGFEEGLKKARIKSEVVFASEIDFCARISYGANFPTDTLCGDIKQVDEHDIPDHDLLLAGFPCQSFSIAGMRRGFEDTRGTLFFDVARILAYKKPRYILLENVKNLITHDGGRTVRKILDTLDEIGYSTDITIINSSEAGVPQSRDRTYICGIYGGKTEEFTTDKRSRSADKLKKRLNGTDFHGFNFFNNISFHNKQRYICDILDRDVGVPFFFNGEEIVEYLRQLNPHDIQTNEPRIVKLFDLPREIYNDLERQRRVYSIHGISPTLLARSDTAKILVEDSEGLAIRKLSPLETFYIQGFDRAFVKNIKSTLMSATQMYKQSGNAVSPPVIAGILKYLYKEYIQND